MTEGTERQKELFEEFETSESKLSFFKNNKHFLQNRIFVFQFSREKLALLLLGLVVLISVVFCLGVERGKTLRPRFQPAQIIVKPAPTPEIPVEKPVPQVTLDRSNIYTIRIATYINKSGAEKAAAKIKQTGFPAYVKASGRFYMICVGDYNDKKQAESVLSRLKKTYRDSYIKTTKR